MSRPITEIIIHCSKSDPSKDLTVNDLFREHRRKGLFKVGYHYIIRRDGEVQMGRDEDMQGHHAEDHNEHSIGVCLVGGVDADGKPQDNFTEPQKKALSGVLGYLHHKYPDALICEHRSVDPGNFCPAFDLQTFLDDWSIL